MQWQDVRHQFEVTTSQLRVRRVLHVVLVIAVIATAMAVATTRLTLQAQAPASAAGAGLAEEVVQGRDGLAPVRQSHIRPFR